MSNIFFDWSGTIKDAFPAHYWVVNNIFKKMGRSGISIDELRTEWVEPYMNFFNKYFPLMTVDEEKELYRSFVINPDYPKSNPVEGMVGLVNELFKQGYSLFLVTSDIENSVMKEIEDYKLSNVFTKIFAEVYDKSIPVLDTIKDFDLSKTFLIGDSVNEINVAKNTGIKSISVTWGFTSKEKLEAEKPDFIVTNPNDILNIINK